MDKHTPGPWTYYKTNGSSTHGPHVIAGGKPGYLAEVRDCGSGCVEANALLIAAAPDLLNALRELRDWYESFTKLPACAANAAINKATPTSQRKRNKPDTAIADRKEGK